MLLDRLKILEELGILHHTPLLLQLTGVGRNRTQRLIQRTKWGQVFLYHISHTNLRRVTRVRSAISDIF